MRRDYPILEFDPSRRAIIEPSNIIQPMSVPEHCVICFFQEVIDSLDQDGRLTMVSNRKWEDGSHPIYELEIDGKRLVLLHPGVGAPMAVGLLEVAIALGCRKFIACGGAGVLDRDIAVGHIIVPAAAVRDEGF